MTDKGFGSQPLHPMAFYASCVLSPQQHFKAGATTMPGLEMRTWLREAQRPVQDHVAQRWQSPEVKSVDLQALSFAL